jgi:hypothetical protein
LHRFFKIYISLQGLKGNGISPHLRSKYEMNELCKEKGLKVNKQILTDNWESASKFIEEIWSSSNHISTTGNK